MRKCHRPITALQSCALFLLLSALLTGPAVEAAKKNKRSHEAAFVGWYEGVAGYRAALEAQKVTPKPILVYFHAPWCPYCKRVNRDVLGSPEVVASLAEVLAVQVNGDGGGAERRLMAEFGTEIFPSLFVRRTPEGPWERIPAFDGAGNLRAAGDFAGALLGR